MRWTDAGPEDILLFQLRESGLSWPDIVVQWNEITGHSYLDKKRLYNRLWTLQRFIGMPPRHLMGMDIRAHWQPGRRFNSDLVV